MLRKPRPVSELDMAIDRVLIEMKGKDPISDDYAKLVTQLIRLNEMKVCNTKPRLSYDTLANIAAHISGIVLILHYERLNVIGTRALTFVQKLR